jgi:UDP-N-acetylmuramyl pentapeptide phosphotransferase/UDP-N-acetylglucosamine-1-phosphate transferase
MGGIAIYLGTVAAVLLLARRQVMPAFAAAASIMFLTGCIDDRKTMSPAAKIIVQLVASAVFVANGHFFDIAPPGGSRPDVFWL